MTSAASHPDTRSRGGRAHREFTAADGEEKAGRVRDALYGPFDGWPPAQAELVGEASGHQGIEFQKDIEDMFYGARQFCIRDLNLNGNELYFIGDRTLRE